MPFPQTPVSVLAWTFHLSSHSYRRSTWGISSTLAALKKATPQKCLSFKQSTWGTFPTEPGVHLQKYQFSQKVIPWHRLLQALTMSPGTLRRPQNSLAITGLIRMTWAFCSFSVQCHRGFGAREASNTPEAPRLLSGRTRFSLNTFLFNVCTLQGYFWVSWDPSPSDNQPAKVCKVEDDALLCLLTCWPCTMEKRHTNQYAWKDDCNLLFWPCFEGLW